MDLKTLMLVWQLITMVAPLVSQIYDAVRALFPDGTPGAVKLDTFKDLVQQAIATSTELQKFEPVFDTAWPMIKLMVDKFHAFQKTPPAQ